MFHSSNSASLMAEDVTVRCRIRKSPCNTINGVGGTNINTAKSHLKISNNIDNPTHFIDMTCTMRNWDSSFQVNSSSNRSGSGSYRLQQSSSRNMLLRNAFSLSSPDLRTDVKDVSEPSRNFGSDSAINVRDAELAKSNHGGPELLFTPTYDVSPSKSARVHISRRISPTSLQPYTIPLNEILLVTYDATNNSNHDLSQNKLYITTLSLGHYDMDCITSNGHDIVLAFLQASLPQERFDTDATKCSSKSKISQSPHKNVKQSTSKTDRKSCTTSNNRSDHDADEVPSVHSTNSSVASSCFDIDALQAKHLAGRADAETWYEKIQRRYGLVVSNILEQFDTCCNNTTAKAAGHSYPSMKTSQTSALYGSTSTTTPCATPRSSVPARKRPLSNGITGCLYGELEMDDNATDCSILHSTPPRVSHRQIRGPMPTQSSTLPPKHSNNRQNTNTGSSQQRDKQYPSRQEHQQVRIAHMPSGLSVEPEPYDTESVR